MRASGDGPARPKSIYVSTTITSMVGPWEEGEGKGGGSSCEVRGKAGGSEGRGGGSGSGSSEGSLKEGEERVCHAV